MVRRYFGILREAWAFGFVAIEFIAAVCEDIRLLKKILLLSI